jgi:hypothetical protein
MHQQLPQEYQFDRPIIIVAAPRSGSTLLFETMSHARSLWTIGDESHLVFEHINELNPAVGICKSNRLSHEHAATNIVERIRQVFLQQLRSPEGRAYSDAAVHAKGKPRFLEKTPKNSLRIPFLNQIFPDARYIYLFRDPRENLSSMIEGWRSSRFVTYRQLPGWPDQWSFLLPPGYSNMQGKPLEEIVAFQWRAANQFILDDLSQLPEERWTALSYSELISDAQTTIERLCRFADIPFDPHLQAHCENALPLSRYTGTAPRPGKWRKNAAMIERVMPQLQSTIESIQNAVAPHTSSAVLLTDENDAGDALARQSDALENGVPTRQQGRNERCHCGSGLRFKHCHGKLPGT